LSDHISSLELVSKRLPKKDVCVYVNEGLILAAICFDLAKRPPVGIVIPKFIQSGGDVNER
jgi:hypothetical protein